VSAVNSPACKDRIHGPIDGFETLAFLEDERDRAEFIPCGHCFPHFDSAEEIGLPSEDLIVGIGPESQAIHRHERTGPVTSNTQCGEEVSLASIIGQPDFGFDDLERSGGDA